MGLQNLSVETLARTLTVRLTLDHDILTSLLVALAVAADSFGQAVALMVEFLTSLTSGNSLHQLTLKPKDQSLGQTPKCKERCTLTKIFHPRHVAPVPAHRPLSNKCSTSSDRLTLDTGGSPSDVATSDSPLLKSGRDRVGGAATMTLSTIPPEAIQACISWRARTNWSTEAGSSQGGSTRSQHSTFRWKNRIQQLIPQKQ